MNKLRKARAAAQAQAPVPLHPFLAGVDDDTPFWRDLPDILQAQLLVMLDNGRPTKKNPKPREAEKLLWAGTPHLRKRTIFLLFSLWMVLLTVPTLLLVELVDEIGGWCALSWAVMSVFIFVPRISRGSREAFALTSRRAVVSKRSMYCSIHTFKVGRSSAPPAPTLQRPTDTLDVTWFLAGELRRHCVGLADDASRRLWHLHLHQGQDDVSADRASCLGPRARCAWRGPRARAGATSRGCPGRRVLRG